jgi:DNA processing protein
MGLSAEQRDWLALAMVPGVGTTYFIRLLARFRTPGAVLRAALGDLSDVVGPALARRIKEYGGAANVDAQARLMDACDASLITLEDAAYPPRLAEIYDPPLLLFVRGELRESDEHAVAVVGTRRATPYGLRMAEQFGRELAARGITVVSGMACGIDAAAHRGALEAGGRTIAVLGCGVDVVYPAENEGLMREIVRQGCVLSQFPMGMQPSKGFFPYRNRIISGLSLGTLIVEAPLQSGALITARQAAEQGREVFAVPGQVGVRNSEGPHALIREGAKLVEKVEDILVELELPAELAVSAVPTAVLKPSAESTRRESAVEPAKRAPAPAAAATRMKPEPAAATRPAAPSVPPPQASPTERKVLAALSPDGSHIDQIAAACRISVSEALSSLTLLELKGLVRQFSGKRFAPR